MYTVIIYGKIETWERTFFNFYDAYGFAMKKKDKGFDVEIVEVY